MKTLSKDVINRLVKQGYKEDYVMEVFSKWFFQCENTTEMAHKNKINELIEAEERLKKLSLKFLYDEAHEAWDDALGEPAAYSCNSCTALNDVLDVLLTGIKHLLNKKEGKDD